MRTKFTSVIQILDYYKDQSKCIELLEQQRWGGRPVCSHCGHSEKIYRTNRGYRCGSKECGKKFSITTGTIYENTKIELRYWLAAIYLVSAHKKGISSHQIARDLGVTQKTAWFLLHRIREMLKLNEPEQLGGTIEVDESFFGGKEKNRHNKQRLSKLPAKTLITTGRNESLFPDDKTPVLGILQRGGLVRAQKVENVGGKTLIPIMVKNVVPESIIYSDEHRGYRKLTKLGFNHQTVVHSKSEYVRGNVHSNGIENFWSLFKRGVIGIYHQVSEKHLNAYCTEFSYRYNTRKVSDQDRFFNLLTQTGSHLRYDDLINR